MSLESNNWAWIFLKIGFIAFYKIEHADMKLILHLNSLRNFGLVKYSQYLY